MSVQRLLTETRHSEIVIHNGTVYLAGNWPTITAAISPTNPRNPGQYRPFLAEAGSDKSKILP